MINKVTLLGRLTREVDLKSLPSGVPVANFSLATNRVWFDKNTNQKQEEVEFHNCQAWNKTAENIAKYVKKGHLLYIEGRLTTRSWDDKTTGEKKYRTEIIVEEMKLLPNNDGRSHDDTDSKPKVEGKGMDTETIDYGDTGVDEGDIPF